MQLFEAKQGGDQCLLVNVTFSTKFELNADLDELVGLAKAANLIVIDSLEVNRSIPDSKFFIGSGKAEELLDIISNQEINLVIFNHPISPSQERNLELKLNCKVIDRTGLILEIFSQRAKTREGRLQVELAHLNYQSTRLVKGWTHLERQKGGIGVRGGPGETQLELDKRMIRDRIGAVQLLLEKVKKQRRLGRASRHKSDIPTIAFVGYTNAGKSTLFNVLTKANVYVQDQLFATLDPTLRKVEVPQYGTVVFSDTVGFIKNLPHDLVEAFSATLEEAMEADLLIHVIDASDPSHAEYIEQVKIVLKQIKSDQKPIIEVYNKIDLLGNFTPEIIYDKECDAPKSVWMSAATGNGVDLLYEAIAHHFHKSWCRGQLTIPVSQPKVRASLYKLGVVESEEISEQGDYLLLVNIAREDLLNTLENNNLELDRCFRGEC